MKRKRILMNWAISYLIILLIPFTTICINYVYSMKSLGHEIYQSNELVVDNVGQGIDNCLKEAYAFYSYLHFENALKSLRSNKEKSEQFYLDAVEMRDRIIAYRTHESSVSCLIYFPDLNYIFDAGSGNESKSYYNTYRMVATDICEYDEWIQMLSGNYRGQLMIREFVHPDTGEACIVYANSLNGDKNQPVNIFISIPVSAIAEFMSELYRDSHFLMLLSDEVGVAWSEEGANSNVQKINELYSAVKSGEESDYYLVSGSSEFDKSISYSMLISEDTYEEGQQHVRNIFVLSLIITLLVVFVVLELLLRRNYQPVSKLIKRMTDNEAWDGNEFDLIERAYMEQMNEKRLLHERLLTQEEIMQSNSLLMMMKGRKTEKYENLLPVIDGKEFVLVGITILSVDREQQHDEIVLFAIDNVFGELISECEVYKSEDGQYLFYLFVIDGDEKAWRDEYLKKADYLKRTLKVWWKQDISIVFSKTERDREKISRQYQDIMEEFLDRKLLGKAAITDICQKSRSLSANQRLVNNIKSLIEENYEDCNFSVAKLAEELGKTSKHISEVYKKETGENVLYTINAKRIDKAQALIRTGKYKLTEVCEMSGFANMNTFRRNFQQITGMLPGKYMEKKDE